MTSVPKPLKYLVPHYDSLKKAHKTMVNIQLKMGIADVISLLAMGTAGGEEARNNRECLKYCLEGKVIIYRPTNFRTRHQTIPTFSKVFDALNTNLV